MCGLLSVMLVWKQWVRGGPAEGDRLPLVDPSSQTHRNKRHTQEHAAGFNIQNACGYFFGVTEAEMMKKKCFFFLGELRLPIGVFRIKGVAESAKPAAHLLLYMNSEEDEEFSLLLWSLSG